MSKMGQHVLEMQEDAVTLTKEQFVAKHGEHNLDFYNVEWQTAPDDEPDYCYPGSDPQQ